jgi:hypothetical protein
VIAAPIHLRVGPKFLEGLEAVVAIILPCGTAPFLGVLATPLPFPGGPDCLPTGEGVVAIEGLLLATLFVISTAPLLLGYTPARVPIAVSGVAIEGIRLLAANPMVVATPILLRV